MFVSLPLGRAAEERQTLLLLAIRHHADEQCESAREEVLRFRHRCGRDDTEARRTCRVTKSVGPGEGEWSVIQRAKRGSVEGGLLSGKITA